MIFESWSYHFADTEKQKKRFRIFFAITQCNSQILIFWQINVAYDDKSQTKSQLIKIWKIDTKTKISQFINRIILLQKLYSIEHVTRCHRKVLKDGDNKFFSIFFTDCQDDAKPETTIKTLNIRTINRKILEMVNRFYTFIESMLRSVLAHNFLAKLPFDFSKKETRIIFHFDIFSLILNRSDTKKTICFVFKLFAKYVINSAVTQKRLSRQSFFTRSNELANKFKNYINKLMKALIASLVGKNKQQDITPLLSNIKDNKNQHDMIFELKNRSFFIIYTFDQFLKLVKNIIKHVNQKGFFIIDDDNNTQKNKRSNLSKDEYPRVHSLNKIKTFLFVDFQFFKLNYWFRLPVIFIAKLSIELAFVKILKIIKSSLFSRKIFKLFSRNEYLQLSSRLISVFTLKIEKSRIYNIFKKYQVLKLHWRESDAVNRIIKTIKIMKQNQKLKNYLRISFDEIYIDEIQNLRYFEIELLLNMIKNNRAFYFAKNTAQIISQNLHFCFQDIKALFYEHFAIEISLTNQFKFARPRLFMLTKNYCSHQRTLDLTFLMMKMLWNSFSKTVDKLESEIEQIHKSIFIFFLNCSV